jgi:hypothetical protein
MGMMHAVNHEPESLSHLRPHGSSIEICRNNSGQNEKKGATHHQQYRPIEVESRFAQNNSHPTI